MKLSGTEMSDAVKAGMVASMLRYPYKLPINPPIVVNNIGVIYFMGPAKNTMVLSP